jgi:nucleoside-diphosphate-sugar epimerase
MTCLVTGAGGFIGSHLVERLARQNGDVRAMVHEDEAGYRFNDDRVTIFEGDLRDSEFVREAVAGCDEVYHVAALQNYLEPSMAEFMAVNVRGTERVMQAALEHGVEKVVYTSS